jgi:hypothetical protein
VLLCTQPFAAVAAREAKAGGLPELARLTVPHDLLALDDEQRRRLAARLIEEALAALKAQG